MASSLRHLACRSSPAGAAASPTPSLLRRFSPDFCALAALRPIRPATAGAKPPRDATTSTEQEQQLAAHWRGAYDHEQPSTSPSPSVSLTEAPDPAALRVGIIGFGNFGQFIARGIQRQGQAVLATSRSDYSGYCSAHGIRFFRSLEALCEEQPDVLLVCSSILSTESVVRAIPLAKLRPDTIVADVLSVKQFPRNLLLEILPPEFGIVCTHPMFGPESGKHSWSKLPFVYEKVRLSDKGDQKAKCHQFLSIFEQEGCRMVEMSCAEHDRLAAGSQFITHTIGRVLAELNLKSTPINTKGYETLLHLTENTVSDSFDLYYGLFMYNVYVAEQMDKLDRAFEDVKRMLYGRLHGMLRKQIVERVPMPGAPSLGSTQAKDSPAAIREETKPLPPRVAAVPSPCHTLSPVAFGTATC
ncbi:arogenate dehydrogenase 2, chloroplastic-like [Hordeum vulgare subsp. vulgare]|uniref:Prephenate/arogenate dehydrogenase domain-containing protein n=1 Tax=Hordeum vulgare subsp. vulgare TaxID=112509 RepID=A0A8I6ZBL8_HORVV|nr:arogenate dehydrogenase 2, chloroplastic-like [Hordeum vulgare subsp. vulgare]